MPSVGFSSACPRCWELAPAASWIAPNPGIECDMLHTWQKCHAGSGGPDQPENLIIQKADQPGLACCQTGPARHLITFPSHTAGTRCGPASFLANNPSALG